MAIRWNTGTTVDGGNTLKASQAVTIPAGVKARDVVFVVFSAFAVAAASETMQAASTGTVPALLGTTQNAPVLNSLHHAAGLFYFVASATDAGKVITGSLVSADTAKWTVALGAWTGVSNLLPVDVSGAATIGSGGSGATITLPAKTTTAAGDWCLQVVGGNTGNGLYTGGAGFTQRETVADASGCLAFIYDSNAPAGAAGSSIGGGVFSDIGFNSQFCGFTVGLAPAAGGDESVIPVFAAAMGV